MQWAQVPRGALVRHREPVSSRKPYRPERLHAVGTGAKGGAGQAPRACQQQEAIQARAPACSGHRCQGGRWSGTASLSAAGSHTGPSGCMQWAQVPRGALVRHREPVSSRKPYRPERLHAVGTGAKGGAGQAPRACQQQEAIQARAPACSGHRCQGGRWSGTASLSAAGSHTGPSACMQWAQVPRGALVRHREPVSSRKPYRPERLHARQRRVWLGSGAVICRMSAVGEHIQNHCQQCRGRCAAGSPTSTGRVDRQRAC